MFEFEFDLQPEYQKSIAVEDIGDFGIIASTIEGAQYYMAVKTILGTTAIATCGPVIPDIEILPNNFSCELVKIPFNAGKIIKKAGLWLNDPYKKIKFAETTSFEAAVANFRDITTYLNNLNEEII